MAKIIVPWRLIAAASGFIMTVIGIVLGWMIIPPVIRQQIAAQVSISEGTEQYERWINLPQPLLFKVYIFNVTNSEEVHRGEALPKVQEIGPYVYKQYRRKENVKFSSDKQKVFYRNRILFKFDEELSGRFSQNDEIVILNTIMNTILQVTEIETKSIVGNILVSKENDTLISSNPVMKIIKRILGTSSVKTILQVTEQTAPAFMASVNMAVDSIFGQKTLFLRTSVRKYLFDGVPFCVNPGIIGNVVCNVIKEKKSKSVFEYSKGMKFAYFRHKNTTDNGLMEADTGISDVLKVGTMLSWNQHPTLSIWNNKAEGSGKLTACNMINGTDGSNYAPYRKPVGSLYIWATDLCRSVELVFKRQSEYKGITTHRFEMGSTFLDELGPEFSTACFCPNAIPHAIIKKNGCMYKGALDLTPCLGKDKLL